MACGDDDGAVSPSPSPTVSPSPTADTTATPTPVPTPVPSPTEDPTLFSSERAYALVEHLASEIGVRSAGSPGETEAAEWIRDELKSYGYDATIQTFPFATTQQLDTDLTVHASATRSFATVAMGGSPTGRAEGGIVVAGIGSADEFPADSGGKIALIERGELTFAQKALNAQAAGIAGVIVYNNEDGPFIGRLDANLSIPVVSMPRDDGIQLADLAGDGPVSASLTVEVSTSQGQSRNVVAEPPSGVCSIIVGGHYDSVANGPGANDNASGTSVAIEMARAMAADGEFDDTCFVLFGAEEIGLVGSYYFVSQLSADERAGIVAMLNFDMLGVGDGWPLVGTSSAVEAAANKAQALGLEYFLSSMPANVGSDHAAFLEAGIPVAFFNCFCDPDYHTSQDVPANVEPERLQEAGDLGMGTIDELLGGP